MSIAQTGLSNSLILITLGNEKLPGGNKISSCRLPTKLHCWCTGHYNDVIMSAMTSHITSLMIVCSTVYSDRDQRKHQSSALLAFVREIHLWSLNSPQKGPVTRRKFPFDDVIMVTAAHTEPSTYHSYLCYCSSWWSFITCFYHLMLRTYQIYINTYIYIYISQA